MADDQHHSELLGLDRWVQFAFVALAAITVFLVDRLINLAWGLFAEPDATVATGAAAIVGILVGYFSYRHPRLRSLADDVAVELSKVTWPSRQETWNSTLVVIVTSIIAAVYFGAVDYLVSQLTDLVYETSSNSST